MVKNTKVAIVDFTPDYYLNLTEEKETTAGTYTVRDNVGLGDYFFMNIQYSNNPQDVSYQSPDEVIERAFDVDPIALLFDAEGFSHDPEEFEYALDMLMDLDKIVGLVCLRDWDQDPYNDRNLLTVEKYSPIRNYVSVLKHVFEKHRTS